MVSRHGFLAKILGGFLIALFMLVILPRIKFSLVALIVVSISTTLMADSLARFFTGKNDWKILLPVALIVLMDVVFFILVPESPI